MHAYRHLYRHLYRHTYPDFLKANHISIAIYLFFLVQQPTQFAELLPTSRQDQLMMETISFAMPLTSKKQAVPWATWQASEMSLIDVKVD
jgi:hypothetical protein